MCDVGKLKAYQEAWDTHFEYVDSLTYQSAMYEDEVYVAYGCNYGLPISDFSHWHRDAENALVSSDIGVEYYISKKYDLRSEEDVNYYIDKEVSEGMIFECNGYWFTA